MEHTEVQGQSADQPSDMSDAPSSAPAPARRTATILSQQAGPGTCATCGAAAGANPNGGEMTFGYVFALGTVTQRFPSPAVEKEFAQTMGRAETAGLTDRGALRGLLSERRNRYLARQLCYVLTIEGTEAYILVPRDPTDIDLLVEAIRPAPSPIDVDVVIGVRGPIAPPEMCNGLLVPIVIFDQIYSFDRDALFAAISPPAGAPAEQAELLRATAQDLFDRILRLADNLGATDEHRAVNYLAVRYDQIYRQTAQQFANNFSLTAVYAIPSRLSSTRRLVNVIFAYTHRQTGVIERYRVRVDVTEEFPFLDSRLEPYYEIER
jgi:cyclic patellamide precursor peptide PatG